MVGALEQKLADFYESHCGRMEAIGQQLAVAKAGLEKIANPEPLRRHKMKDGSTIDIYPDARDVARETLAKIEGVK